MKKDSFVHVSKNGTFVKEALNEEPTFPIRGMKHLLGDESGDCWIECVYNQFTNRDIVIICDEEFLLKKLIHPMIITPRGIAVRGACIITGLIRTEDGLDVSYLTKEESLEALLQMTFVPA